MKKPNEQAGQAESRRQEEMGNEPNREFDHKGDAKAGPDQNPQEETSYPGYPHYPKKEDIYKNENKEPLNRQKEDRRPQNPGDELDVPGSELDDAREDIGEEDEENNYYSLGGDNHEDLEEPEA